MLIVDYLSTTQTTGWEEHPQNDLLYVKWDVQHLLNLNLILDVHDISWIIWSIIDNSVMQTHYCRSIQKLTDLKTLLFGGRKGTQPVKKLSGGVLAWLYV